VSPVLHEPALRPGLTRRHLALVGLGLLFGLVTGTPAAAEPVAIDRTVVRFTSPETGGVLRPRFITERELTFEARLLACAEEGRLVEAQERHLRAAVEQHVAVEMLVRLPLEPEPDANALLRVANTLRSAVADRVGGDEVLEHAAKAEGLELREVDASFVREARAALYVERAIVPVLYPSDDVLRDVYRTTAHPYRQKRYEDARELLERWFAFERLRATEALFLQSARSRVKITFLN
jgi:hypothetical protein